MGLKHSTVTRSVLFMLLAIVSSCVVSACASLAAPLPEVEFTVVRLSPDFPSDGVVFVGTVDHGIFRSDDHGESWQGMNTGIEKSIVMRKGTPEPGSLPAVADIALSPSFDEDGEVYAASGYLYRSSDRGETWSPFETTPFGFPFRIAVSLEYEKDGTLFIRAELGTGGSITYLWRSQDEGANWKRVWDISPIWKDRERLHYYQDIPNEVKFLPDSSIVGTTRRIVACSRDYGASWAVLFEGEDIGSISVSSNFSEDGIAFLSDNMGRENIRRLVVDQGEVVDLGFGTAFDWITCPAYGAYGGAGCPIPVAVSPTFEADGMAFASVFLRDVKKTAFMRSVDKGVTWKEMELPSSDKVISTAMSPKFSEDNTVFVATRSALFVSRDAGDTWEQTGY